MYLLLFLLFSTASFADLPSMAKELLENNSSILQAKTNIEAAKYDADLLKANKNWSISYIPSYSDSNLKQFTLPSTPDVSTTSHTFLLTKKLEWGGELNFSKSLVKNAGDNSNYLFVQGINYSQDLGANFLGRLFYKDVRIAENKNHIATINEKQEIQNQLLNLTRQYSNARLYKGIISLEEKAKKRAVKRLKLVRRRVRDGVREKVDLYRAQALVQLHEEQIRNAMMGLEKATNELSNLLHRKVKEDTLKSYSFEHKVSFTMPVGKLLNNNEILILKEQEGLLAARLEKINNQMFPKINLEMGYKTNAIEATRNQAYKAGRLGGGDNREKKIALSLSFPIGHGSQKNRRSKIKSQLNLSKMQQVKTAHNIKEMSKRLSKNIYYINENISSAKKRRELSIKALNELNNLYKKGIVGIDSVISMEEELILLEKSFVNYLANRDMAAYNLAYLYGELNDYILGDQKIEANN